MNDDMNYKYEVVIVYTDGSIDRKKTRTKKGARAIKKLAKRIDGFQKADIRGL